MKTDSENPYEALEKIFHEPNRLAIMSSLCSSEKGLTFNELKEACRLTDGNLNRHLKVLEEAKAVSIHKEFVDLKPRTTVHISKKGLESFSEYLDALNEVLLKAKESIPSEKKARSFAGLLKHATA